MFKSSHHCDLRLLGYVEDFLNMGISEDYLGKKYPHPPKATSTALVAFSSRTLGACVPEAYSSSSPFFLHRAFTFSQDQSQRGTVGVFSITPDLRSSEQAAMECIFPKTASFLFPASFPEAGFLVHLKAFNCVRLCSLNRWSVKGHFY